MRAADLEVLLADHPGALAELGETLGAAGVSLEGGGVFTHEGTAIAHFLVDDPERGRDVLQENGIGPVHVHDVVTLRLDQEVPGQLGAFTRRLAEAGINILVQYSDHDHRLVLVVDPAQHGQCADIAAQWDTERTTD
ncbi:ACT domain-containing protein [Ornithinimicrobium faecis]|uniref:ACT domain-containing protein n=1 Tax=Ornithinimicrobium faecis TaxID=2934158 RepID=A0ABY4YTY9_9MICO|nr:MULTISPECIES: ACT domain-containing protein [unclassified Ornithinimicrobium]USQ80233.1 hypothetical protein NF556_00795 [Ornithinimicrobium sp. HY1793]